MKKAHPDICRLWSGHPSYDHFLTAIKTNLKERAFALPSAEKVVKRVNQLATYVFCHGISMTRHAKNTRSYTQYPTILHGWQGIFHRLTIRSKDQLANIEMGDDANLIEWKTLWSIVPLKNRKPHDSCLRWKPKVWYSDDGVENDVGVLVVL